MSFQWTYWSIQSNNNTSEPIQELFLTITPEYKITSNKDLRIWPAGTVFKQGMVAYFYAALPEINVTPLIELDGFENGLLEGSIEIQVYIQAIDDKSQVYWTYQINNPRIRTFTLSKGIEGKADQSEFRTLGVSLDVLSAYELVNEVREELMFPAGFFQLVVSSIIRVDGTANGVPIEREIVQEFPISLQTNTFSISKSIDAVSQVPLIIDSNNLGGEMSFLDIIRENLFPVSVSFVLIIILISILSRNLSKSKAAIEHKRYKEWITEGNVTITGKLLVNILNLQGLVDLAIDLDKRVIFDIKTKKYFVLTEDIVYVYDIAHSTALLENKQQLGKVLLERRLISPEQLETGLYYQQRMGIRLGESLMALGFMNETTLYSTLASQKKIEYYEPDLDMDNYDTSWINKMSIQQAKTLMVVPVGKRIDGKYVIACSEISNDAIVETLQELLVTEIQIIAAAPSRIYEMLDRIEKYNYKTTTKETEFQNLSKNELKQFSNAYYRGVIEQDILLKAVGIINKKDDNGEIINLIKGLEKIIEKMSWKDRNENYIPDLLDLLIESNYLTQETVEWVNKEISLEKVTLNQFLSLNYIVSENTIKNAGLLLTTLENILNISRNET
ncbi:MAG: hypothetical protein K0R15_2702 [Clostridiales bacterium]|nr:hypothetical protein [Clostridiales bacterium]